MSHATHMRTQVTWATSHRQSMWQHDDYFHSLIIIIIAPIVEFIHFWWEWEMKLWIHRKLQLNTCRTDKCSCWTSNREKLMISMHRWIGSATAMNTFSEKIQHFMIRPSEYLGYLVTHLRQKPKTKITKNGKSKSHRTTWQDEGIKIPFQQVKTIEIIFRFEERGKCDR